MSIRILHSDQKKSNYDDRVTLEGSQYILRYRWNQRDGKWYFSILDSDGTLLATGRKIVVNTPLVRRDTNPLLPGGIFYALDTEDTGADPGLGELGTRVKFLYIDESSIA